MKPDAPKSEIPPQQPSTQVALAIEALGDPPPDPAPAAGPGSGDPPPPLEGEVLGRPWKPWVALGEGMVVKICNGWDWTPDPNVIEVNGKTLDLDGRRLMFDGIEKQLTVWMPNGLIDLEKYPVIMVVLGAVMMGLRNLQAVQVGDEVKYSVKPFIKPKVQPPAPTVETKKPAPPEEPKGSVTVTA